MEYICPKINLCRNLCAKKIKLSFFIKLYMNIVVLVGLVDYGDEKDFLTNPRSLYGDSFPSSPDKGEMTFVSAG